MKTKIFSLKGIGSVILLVFFLSFAMANTSIRTNDLSKEKTIISTYVISMDAMEVMYNPVVLNTASRQILNVFLEKIGAEVNLTEIFVVKIYASTGTNFRFKENVDTQQAEHVFRNDWNQLKPNDLSQDVKSDITCKEGSIVLKDNSTIAARNFTTITARNDWNQLKPNDLSQDLINKIIVATHTTLLSDGHIYQTSQEISV